MTDKFREMLNNEIAEQKADNVTTFFFATQYTDEVISIVSMPIDDVAKNAETLFLLENPTKDSNCYRLRFKSTRTNQKILVNYPTVMTFSPDEIENLVKEVKARSEKFYHGFNRGNALEIKCFNISIEESITSKDKTDGIINGEHIQLKASVKPKKENGKFGTFSSATIRREAV